MMDVPTALTVVGVFVFVFASLLFVYKFGIKEKSYEEALAEQRQQTNALLGVKPKPKEKKPKKLKKSKEKQTGSEAAEKIEESESVDSGIAEPSHKLHVEFKEPELIDPEKDVPAALNKKRTKKEKVRPILVHKEKEPAVDKSLLEKVVETPPANHFEELHPKDEFELLVSHIKEEAKPEPIKEKHGKAKQNNVEEANQELPKEKTKSKQDSTAVDKETVKEKPSKLKQSVNDQEVQKSGKKTGKQQIASEQVQVAVIVEEVAESAVIIPKQNGIVTNTGKEKKKKKSEFNTLQQLASDKEGVNLPILLNLVRKADLSRSEVQILIDLLLNKQHEAPTVDDWSEGKSDPVQKLKRQLAEKEKLLEAEQEALVGAQAKLREIRAEQNAEKSQYQQKIRALEDALQNRQIEFQAVNSRLHGQTQKLQQLQGQLNDELINSHKLREEHSALLAQKQQIECRIAQTQDAESIIAQLRSEIQELTNQNSQLNMDCLALSDQTRVEREAHQGYMNQLKMQLATFQKDLEQKNQLLQQEEAARLNLEHRLDLAYRQEKELKTELTNVKADELHRIESLELKAREEVSNFQKQKDEFEKLIAKLRADLTEMKLENDKLQTLQENGTIEDNKVQVECLNLQNEMVLLKSQLQETEQKYVAELQSTRTVIEKLESDIKEQRNKNDELRKKNWKVMEALNAAESRIKVSANVKSSPVKLDEATSKVCEDEQKSSRQFIQRLFPDLKKKLSAIPQEKWTSEAENIIVNYLDNLQKQQQTKVVDTQGDVAKLQTQVSYYKTVIDDTEGMLNKLQKHIEQEEIRWRSQLKNKDLEIQNLQEQHLKQEFVSKGCGTVTVDAIGMEFAYKCIEKSLPMIVNELQQKVSALEAQLASEKEEKQVISQELITLRSHSSSQNNSTAVIERLSEEVNRLREQLQNEQKRNGDTTFAQPENEVPVKAQNHSTNGPSLIQPNFSYSSSADSSLTEVSVKPKNKKKKKKGSGN